VKGSAKFGDTRRRDDLGFLLDNIHPTRRSVLMLLNAFRA
jgi:hypothetical protein